MAYTPLQKDTVISHTEINDNFTFVGVGDIQPRQGVSLTSVNDTLNLGSDTKRWKDIHIQTLDMSASQTVTNTFSMISEVTLSGSASEIEFTGLNGDVDNVYIITGAIVSDSGTSTPRVNLFLSNTQGSYSASSVYRTQFMQTSKLGTASGNETGGAIAQYANRRTTITGECIFEAYLFSKTGQERLFISDSTHEFSASAIENRSLFGSIWSNTDMTITAMLFKNNLVVASTMSFMTGTNIQIWAKR